MRLIILIIFLLPSSVAASGWFPGAYTPEASERIINPRANTLIESFAKALGKGSFTEIARFFPPEYSRGHQRELMQIVIKKYSKHGAYLSAKRIALERCSIYSDGNSFPNCLYTVSLKFEHGEFLESVVLGRLNEEVKIVSILSIQPRTGK